MTTVVPEMMVSFRGTGSGEEELTWAQRDVWDLKYAIFADTRRLAPADIEACARAFERVVVDAVLT